MKKKKKLKKRIKIFLVIISVLVLVNIVYIFNNSKKEINTEYKVELSNIKPKTKLEEYQATVNKDIIGYFTFKQNDNAATQTLPVILTNDDFYMTHNMYGKKDSCGAVFIDSNEFSDESNNIIVYGHSSTKKNCNFTFFKNFKDKTYFNKNEYFTYTDKDGEHKYEILFMSLIDMESIDGVYLDWYNSYFHDTDEFDDVLNKTSEYSVSEKREFTIDEDDKILTLVTCDMSKKDARFVLFAKEKFK